MAKYIFVFLSVSSLFLSGCLPQPEPAVPAVTSAELNQALISTESNVANKIEQTCQNWTDHQQTQAEQLTSLRLEQKSLTDKLDAITEKLNTPPPPPPVAPIARKTQCPPAGDVIKFNNKMIVGEVEWLWLESVDQVYEARVDTGATTSSISAANITPFEKDGQPWVRFQLAPDDSENQFEVEAPLVRYVRIRQASSEELDRRPVASLTVRMGKMTEVAEFTLTDRSDMNYPILLGREFLKDIAIVDVARKNIQPKPIVVGSKTEIKATNKTSK